MRRRRTLPPIVAQALRFGAVGGVGLVVNVVVFNLLRTTVLAPERLAHGPLVATVVATACAIALNWVGNRFWAFSEGPRRPAAREGAEFLVVSVAAMAIPLGCLAVSRYVLGFTSLAADNVANNVVGLLIGTAFRFALYRWWVFAPSRRDPSPSGGPAPTSPEAPAAFTPDAASES